ncbi:MAG TPA: glycoside hydrolase family 13 protein [Candidatus Limnocylindrales bacterium]
MRIETPEWVRDAVFYQIFPDRFARSGRVEAPGALEPWAAPPTAHGFKGGDLYGVAEHLDHLATLGITAIYFNPVFASASNHRYHTYDYHAVDPLLGGDAALRELLDAAHARGIRVILDGVFNHASRGFWPFNHVLECGIGSPYVDWFHVDREALAAGRPLRAYPDESLLQAVADSEWATVHHAGAESMLALGYKAWWDLPALPKLNTDNPIVREFIFDVAERWIRFGADGWRLDVAAEIDDDEFWREFRRRVKAIDPEAYIVAEIWDEDHRWLNGDEFDAYMNYPFAEATISFCAGSHLDMRVVGQQGNLAATVRPIDAPAFAERLAHALTSYAPEINAVQLNLLDSHDTPRLLSLCGGDVDSVRLATLVQMTVPGAPSIYYGDEIGMAGEHDPDCRRSFPWDDRAAWDMSLLAFVRGAAALRHAHRALRRGSFDVVAADGMTVAYRRSDETGDFVICLNAGDAPAAVGLSLPRLDGVAFEPMTWDGWTWGAGERMAVADGRAVVEIGPREGRVFRRVD